MWWRGRDLLRFSVLNCGTRRERGTVRTSTSILVLCACRIARNSSRARVEWPIVKSFGGGLDIKGLNSGDEPGGNARTHGRGGPPAFGAAVGTFETVAGDVVAAIPEEDGGKAEKEAQAREEVEKDASHNPVGLRGAPEVPTNLCRRVISDVSTGLEPKDHLPQAVAFAALDDFDRLESPEGGVGSVKPRSKCFRIDHRAERFY